MGGTARKVAAYLAGLTALYIVIYRSTNTGIVLDHATQGVAGIEKGFLQ